MNLMVVSEKHGLIIIGVGHELFAYQFDPVSMVVLKDQKYKRYQLDNDNV